VITRVLDRLQQFDERSREFPIRSLVGDKPLRSYTWSCAPHFDQKSEGACVGHGFGHEAAARPVVRKVTQQDCFDLYRRARQLDEWPGENYEGTSVLAGAKAMAERSWLQEYRWGFSLDDVLRTVGYLGPVVIGVNWYTGMFEPDPTGLIHATGQVEGGHCTLVKGVNVSRRQVRIHQSWGAAYGLGGDVLLSWDDLGMLLKDGGEACVPVRR
jgi:hypothetical protein